MLPDDGTSSCALRSKARLPILMLQINKVYKWSRNYIFRKRKTCVALLQQFVSFSAINIGVQTLGKTNTAPHKSAK